MIIRSFEPKDITWVVQMHEKHFKEEFELPNFLKGYHCVYTIENDKEIIVVGGVRPLAELVVVTDMDTYPRPRVEALRKMTQAGVFTAGAYHYDQLHCFVQGEAWIRQVQSVHFRPTVGTAMVMDL